ncbi:MAG: hypothetical protein WCF16_03190 [Alphaproteobacteria bacterium]
MAIACLMSSSREAGFAAGAPAGAGLPLAAAAGGAAAGFEAPFAAALGAAFDAAFEVAFEDGRAPAPPLGFALSCLLRPEENGQNFTIAPVPICNRSTS